MWLARSDRYGLDSLRAAVPPALAFLFVSLVTIAITVAQGSSLGSLLSATVTRAARMASLWYLEIRLDDLTVTVAMVGTAAAILYVVYGIWRRDEANLRPRYSWQVDMGRRDRLLCVRTERIPRRRTSTFLISFAAPFAWLLVAPDLTSRRNPLPRMFLATATVFEVLLVYPVAGSQHAFSTFLFLPAAVVSLSDGLAGLNTLLQRHFAGFELQFSRTQRALELRLALIRESTRKPRWPSVTAKNLACCLLVVAFGVTGYKRISSGQGVRHEFNKLVVPSYLAGAERLRMPFDTAGLYHWLVSNIEANCDSFVTEPFYGSLHLWTNLQPLTGMNPTGWMTLLTSEEQLLIVKKTRDPKARLRDLQRRECRLVGALQNGLPYKAAGQIYRRAFSHPAFSPRLRFPTACWLRPSSWRLFVVQTPPIRFAARLCNSVRD